MWCTAEHGMGIEAQFVGRESYMLMLASDECCAHTSVCPTPATAAPAVPLCPCRLSIHTIPAPPPLRTAGRHRTLRALWYARWCALRCAHSSSLGQSFDAVRPQPVGSTLSYLRDGARCLCFFTQVLLSVWTIWTVRTLTIETASKFGQSSRPFPWRRAQSLASHASDGQWSGRSGPREQS